MLCGKGTTRSNFVRKVYRSESEPASTSVRAVLVNMSLNGLSEEEMVRFGEDCEPESTMIH